MKKVWGFAFFWFGVGMIVGNLIGGFWDFFLLFCSLMIAYILFCRQ